MQNKIKLPSLVSWCTDVSVLYGKNFWKLFGIAAIPVVSLIISKILEDMSPMLQVPSILFYAHGILLFFVSPLAFTRVMSHESSSIIGAYRFATYEFFGFFGMCAVAGLIALGGFVVGILPGLALGKLIFGIVPALILAIWFSLKSAIFVVEEKRGFMALMQSREYIRNYFWEAALRIALATLILFSIVIILVPASSPIVAFFSLFGLLLNVGFVQNVLVSLLILPLAACFGYGLYKNFVAIKPELQTTPVTRTTDTYVFLMVLGLVCAALGSIKYFFI